MGSISHHQLLIALGADTHTQIQTHTDICGQSHSKEPGMHQSAAGMRLV